MRFGIRELRRGEHGNNSKDDHSPRSVPLTPNLNRGFCFLEDLSLAILLRPIARPLLVAVDEASDSKRPVRLIFRTPNSYICCAARHGDSLSDTK